MNMGQEPLVSYRNAWTRCLNLVVSALLSPLEIFLEWRARNDREPVCFIVGPPRSGSTLLYEMVTARFQCGYLSNLSNRLFRVPVAATWFCQRAMRRRGGSFDSVYGELGGYAAPSEAGRVWAHWMPYAAPYFRGRPGLSAARMQRKLAAIARSAGKPVIVKNMILQSDFPLLLKTFPNALFIYVERDRADNARSLVKARQDKTSMDGTGWWSLRPTGWESYAGADPVTQSCAQVILSHRDLESGLTSLGRPERVIRLRYEDICRAPEVALDRIETFLRGNGANVLSKPMAGPAPEITARRQPEDDIRARIVDCLNRMTPDTLPRGEAGGRRT